MAPMAPLGPPLLNTHLSRQDETFSTNEPNVKKLLKLNILLNFTVLGN